MRKPLSAAGRRFREAACEALSRALGGESQAAAARKLGISRARLNTYVRGKCTPPPDVLAAACSIWKFEVVVDNRAFPAAAFRRGPAPAPIEAVQRSLFEALRRNEPRLRVRVRRTPQGLALFIAPSAKPVRRAG